MRVHARVRLLSMLAVTLCGFLVAMGGFGGGRVRAAGGDAAVSQGFQAATNDSAVVNGALVSLKSSSTSTVTPANTDNAGNLVGVINKTTLLALSGTSDQVQVAIVGDTPTLVSDINGPIKAGDKITASPINGVGMKATANTEIVGIAQQNFDTTSAKTETINDKNGRGHTVRIGTLTTQVSISYYLAPTSNVLPPFLQNLANSIAGKPVSVMRILVACVLLLLASIGIFILLYTAIHSGIISIGRNPLAAHAINRGLISVGLTTLLILAFALVATYVILAV